MGNKGGFDDDKRLLDQRQGEMIRRELDGEKVKIFAKARLIGTAALESMSIGRR